MILVTGGMGFIGVHTVRCLLDRDQRVVVGYHSTQRIPEFWEDAVGGRVFPERVDVTNAEDVQTVMRTHHVERVIHLAMPGVAGLTPIEDFRTSAIGLMNVLEAARLCGVKRITFASSSTVYSGLRRGPYREDATLPLESRNATEAYKKAGEIVLFHYADRTGLDVNAIRTRTVYGPMYYSLVNVPSRLCHAAVTGRQAEFPTSGPGAGVPFEDDTTDLSYVRDVAEIFARAALVDHSPYRVYNVSQGCAVSYGQLAAAVRKAEPTFSVTLQPGANPRGEPPANYLDVTRIKDVFGYVPQWDHERAVADYVAWLRGHPV
jgi:UDP-glucose 4-epimerase